MVKNLKSCLFLLFFLVLSFSVYAQPPFQTNPEGLVLQVSFSDFHKLNSDKYVHTHVYDRTSGVLVNESLNCYYHVYSFGLGGTHLIINGTLAQYGAGYEDWINSSNFSSIGDYAIMLWCNSTTQGGFFEYVFAVNEYGTKPPETPYNQIWVFGSAIFLLVLIGVFNKSEVLRFCSLLLAFIQFWLFVAVMNGHENLVPIRWVLGLNLWFLGVVGGAIVFLSLVLKTVGLMAPESKPSQVQENFGFERKNDRPRDR